MTALVLLLASCTGGSTMFNSGARAPQGRTAPPVMFEAVSGLPLTKREELSRAMAATGGERDIGILEGSPQSGSYRLSGQFQAQAEKSGVRVLYRWQLVDEAGAVIQTIDGEDNAGLAVGVDPWSAVTPAVTERIARRSTEAMARKLRDMGYATRVSALTVPPAEYFALASPDAQREIDFETLNGPGMEYAGLDLVAPPEDPALANASTEPLPIEAEMAETAIAPDESETRTRVLPRAETYPETLPETPAGTAVAEAGANEKPAAKSKAGTAMQIRAVAVMPVKGSPGGGDAELTAAMRKTLAAAGWPVVTKRAPDALTIVGRVKVAARGAANQSVSVRWEVQSPDGKTLGDVKQANDVPNGTLDRGWGPAAFAVAEAAAGGIFDIVNRFQ